MKIIVTSRTTELTGPRSEWLGGREEDEEVVGNMNRGRTLVRFGKEKKVNSTCFYQYKPSKQTD